MYVVCHSSFMNSCAAFYYCGLRVGTWYLLQHRVLICNDILKRQAITPSTEVHQLFCFNPVSMSMFLCQFTVISFSVCFFSSSLYFHLNAYNFICLSFQFSIFFTDHRLININIHTLLPFK